MRTAQPTTAEAVIAAQLEPGLGSLPMGRRLRLMLEQDVYDGVRWRAGRHIVGCAERLTPAEMRIRLVDTEAGRMAAALLEEDLLDVELSRDYPPTVRLT